jgi:hypothetical protein
MQESSADHARPRNPEVEAAWIKYAGAFESRARLASMTQPTLAQDYAAVELARIRAIEDKDIECKDRLMEYFEVFDRDQCEAFGGINGT